MSLVDDLITMTSAAASEQEGFSSATSGMPVAEAAIQAAPETGTWEDIGYGWKGNAATQMVMPSGSTTPVPLSSLKYEDYPIGEGGRRQGIYYGDQYGAPLMSNGEAEPYVPTNAWYTRSLLFPGEEQSSGPFGTSFVDTVVNAGSKVTNAIGNAVDYTMNEVVGSDLMKDISELTPLLSKAIMTYAGGAPMLAAMTAAETGAQGGQAQDVALNSLVAYLSSVGSQYAGAAMSGALPNTEAAITQPNTYGGPGEAFAVDPELAAFSETLPEYVEPIAPYTFGEGAAPATVNPGLVYENTAKPFVFGGGATPFKVNTALDPAAEPVSSGTEWQDYVKWGKQLAKLLAGGSETGTGGFGTVTEQLPGKSPNMDNLIELISGGNSTKPSRITSSEVPVLPYGATLVDPNQMEKYNPQQLYYS